MDQVKKGFSIFLAFFFKHLSAIKGKSITGLDSPAPRPSMNDPSQATSSEIGESHYLCSDEKSLDNCPVSK